MFKKLLLYISVGRIVWFCVAQVFCYVTLSDSDGQIIPLNTTFATVQIGLN